MITAYELFLGESFDKPFKRGDLSIFTNGKSAAFARNMEIEPNQKWDKPEPHDFFGTDWQPEYTLAPIELPFKMVPETEIEDCKECDGDGQVEWQYGRCVKMDDCPVCNGAGGYEKRTGRMVEEYDDVLLNFFGTVYAVELFGPLFKAAQMLSQPIYCARTNQPQKLNFRIGEDFYAVIMPLEYNRDGLKEIDGSPYLTPIAL